MCRFPCLFSYHLTIADLIKINLCPLIFCTCHNFSLNIHAVSTPYPPRLHRRGLGVDTAWLIGKQRYTGIYINSENEKLIVE